jgi:hypothetical protein
MIRHFKQCFSTIPPISTTTTITSNLNSLNIKKTTTYDVGNQCPGLGQACVGINPVNGIPTHLQLIIGSSKAIHI